MIGQGSSSLSIIISASVASTFIFYIYTLGSYFKIPIYVIHSRITDIKTFAGIYIVNRDIDHIIIACATVLWLVLSISGKARFVASGIYGALTVLAVLTGLHMILDAIALISVPIVLSLLIYNKISNKKILNLSIKLAINYFAIICMAIGIASMVVSGTQFFSGPQLLTSTRNYAYEIFLLASSSSTVLIFLLTNSFALKLLIDAFLTRIPKIKNYSRKIVLSLPAVKLKSSNKVLFLSCIMLLSVAIVLIPHLPSINKYNLQIGTDTAGYVKWENKLINSKGAQEFLENAFVKLSGGDRPLTLIFLLAAVKISPGSTTNLLHTLDLVPLVLAPALVLAVFFLTRELTSNDTASLLASFLTALSFQTLIGTYSGFYANWLALIAGYLSIVFLFRFLKTSCKMDMILYFILNIILLFSHTYTWTIFTIVISIFLVVLLKFNNFPRTRVALLLVIVLSSVIVDIAKMKMTGSSGGIEQDIGVAHSQGVGPGQFALRWTNLKDATQIYFGSIFSNFIVLILGLYWLFRSNLHETSNILLVVFLSTGLLPLFFGDWHVQTRVLYNIPFQIPAGIALAYIKREIKGSILLLLPVCTWMISISIQIASNVTILQYTLTNIQDKSFLYLH